MTDTKYIDFEEIKRRVSLDQVIEMLGLRMRRTSGQFRSPCPVHGGTDRTLVITPNKGFYCFAERKGGDQIALCAHIRGIGNKEAALAIAEHFRVEQPKPVQKQSTPEPPADGLKPLDYLDTSHEILELLGLSSAVCEALGAGYAPKGTMLGRVAIPLRLEDGTLMGYFGIATRPDQEPLLKFPPNLEERCCLHFTGTAEKSTEEPEKLTADDMRKLLRVV